MHGEIIDLRVGVCVCGNRAEERREGSRMLRSCFTSLVLEFGSGRVGELLFWRRGGGMGI